MLAYVRVCKWSLFFSSNFEIANQPTSQQAEMLRLLRPIKLNGNQVEFAQLLASSNLVEFFFLFLFLQLPIYLCVWSPILAKLGWDRKRGQNRSIKREKIEAIVLVAQQQGQNISAAAAELVGKQASKHKTCRAKVIDVTNSHWIHFRENWEA